MSWELYEVQKSTSRHHLAKYLLYDSSLSHLHADNSAMQDLLKLLLPQFSGSDSLQFNLYMLHSFLSVAKQRSTLKCVIRSNILTQD